MAHNYLIRNWRRNTLLSYALYAYGGFTLLTNPGCQRQSDLEQKVVAEQVEHAEPHSRYAMLDTIEHQWYSQNDESRYWLAGLCALSLGYVASWRHCNKRTSRR
jgi:hypothetical protein